MLLAKVNVSSDPLKGFLLVVSFVFQKPQPLSPENEELPVVESYNPEGSGTFIQSGRNSRECKYTGVFVLYE